MMAARASSPLACLDRDSRMFFAIILGTTLTLELLKAWGAAKLKVFFNPQRTTIMNRCAGVLLVLCGLYFIVFRGIMNLI